MATIKDVSKLAGVSVATVSRVINRKGYVGEKTEQSVLAAMKALKFRPDHTARSLAGKGSSTVGLMIPDILNPFFPEVARAIEDVANASGFNVMLCNTVSNMEKERRYLEMLASKRVDGIIIASYTIQPERILDFMNEIPVVLIDNPLPNDSLISIASNNLDGAALAVRHLLEEGCTKIGHIRGPLQVTAAHERSLGYEQACSSASWFVPSLIAQGNFHIEGGERAMLELIERHPDLDGVFAGNDLMAIGALQALYRLGIQVPEQVKVIGFDGVALNMSVPALTTIAQPIYSIGALAMELLLRLIRGEPVERKLYELDVKLLIRDTTRRTR
ncbi:LacI family DNA-binding transcriptional regulator [Cohnella sp. GCM10012308]|uniref:LacI family DNA-binding transcriptional regulator n=1 Tax=Cohnella sp. GCM10012308 TaxID=3317329 RepID=UPI003612F2CB